MENRKASVPFDKIIIVATLVTFIATIFLYPSLPEAIPYRWETGGIVKTVGKWFAFVTALFPVIIYYLVKLRSKNQSEVKPFVISLLFLIIHWIVILICI